MRKLNLMLLVCFVCGLAIGQEKYKTIVVQPKQSFYSIARDYDVPVAELKKLNTEYAPDFQLKIGDKFKIPVKSATATTQSEVPKIKTEPISTIAFHTVKKGETLSLIAQKYGMTQKELRTLNYMGEKSVVKIGQKLKVKKAEAIPTKVVEKNEQVVAAQSQETRANTADIHVVQKGETLFFIAKKYGTSIRLLSDWNNLGDSPVIKVGQTLRVKGDAIPVAPSEPITFKPINAVVEEVVEKNEPIQPKTEDPTLVEIKNSEVPTQEKTVELAAKEAVPTDNPPAPKTEPIVPEKTIEPVPELPKVVSAQLESDYKEAVNPTTKRTLRGIGVAVNDSELTSAAFVLYDYAEIGDIVKVANLMSKKVMYLKVIGKMKNATEETILQVSSDAAKMLQANEDRFLVEVTGY